MSSGELLLIFIVALIVFGPAKLPMLAQHLGLLVRKTKFVKEQIANFWQQQLHELQLHENLRKAEEGDEHYKNNPREKPN